jgi:nucleoside-diphosphate-sugar epimerase
VFVTGATGVLGRRAVTGLVAAGHRVTGVARTPEKASMLSDLGATAVEVDLFDAAAVKDAIIGHDVVCNLATHIPRGSDADRAESWVENARLRSEASVHVVDGAIASGASRLVQESISFLYADGGDRWLTEDDELDVPRWAASTLDAERQAARFTNSGGIGVVLRFGLFRGPDSEPAALGTGRGWFSSVSTDDAASAVVAALRAPAGIYNVVEDDPTTRDRYPHPAVRASVTNPMLARSHRVSNRRFKEVTGWVPTA